MPYTCSICLLNPQSHSLTKILEKDNTIYFYTCPSNSFLHFDKTGIISHYNGVLSEIPENKEWVWIFDGTYYNAQRGLHIDLAICMTKIIKQFSNNLKKIIIINPNLYISSIYKIVSPFINNKMKNVVNIIKEPKTLDEIKRIL